MILEYLAEVFHFASTRPANALERALESEAMALVDTILVPRLLTSDSDVKPRLVECLEVIEGAVARTANPSLLTFHAAPVWLRFQWWHPAGAVTTQIRRHSRLRAWLDAAAANHGIVKTAPDPAQNIADFSSLFPTA